MVADVISEGNVAVTGVESFSSLGFVVGIAEQNEYTRRRVTPPD